MSGQRYAQATSEESTELVTNRTAANPLRWNASIANYEQPTFESQSSTNLVTNLSNLHLSAHSNSHIAPVLSQFSGGTTSFPNAHIESRGLQNAEITAIRQAAVPDQHLRYDCRCIFTGLHHMLIPSPKKIMQR